MTQEKLLAIIEDNIAACVDTSKGIDWMTLTRSNRAAIREFANKRRPRSTKKGYVANRGKAWHIDHLGQCHAPHPTSRGITLCRRGTAGMEKSWRGDLETDCHACLDLIHMKAGGQI